MDFVPDDTLDARVLDFFRATTDPMARAKPDFPERLAALRKAKGLTQQALAELVGLHTMQIHRYEADASQPTLDVIRRLAVALSVSADALVFGEGARGPDEELRLQFEAIQAFSADEKKVAKAVLESLILKHQARRWASAS
jgi:transcriptional regulator with XRE-family HTH domain